MIDVDTPANCRSGVAAILDPAYVATALRPRNPNMLQSRWNGTIAVFIAENAEAQRETQRIMVTEFLCETRLTRFHRR